MVRPILIDAIFVQVERARRRQMRMILGQRHVTVFMITKNVMKTMLMFVPLIIQIYEFGSLIDAIFVQVRKVTRR